MDSKTIARVGAVVFVAVAIVATAVEINRKPEQPDTGPVLSHPLAAKDPLDADLVRCSDMGEAGSRDPSCLKAWAKARRRFLGQATPVTPSEPAEPSTSSVSPAPTTLFPSAAPSADPGKPAGQPAPAQVETH